MHITQQSGIKIIYVHARKAILKGISPKKNRTVPTLKYDYVSRIKNDFPEIQFIINGGINNLSQAFDLCKKYDGIMVGRLIQSNPFCLLNIDKIFFDDELNNNKYENIVVHYFKYVKEKIGTDSIFRLLSPLLAICFGLPNSKKFKAEIHQKIINYEIDDLEKMFLKFVE